MILLGKIGVGFLGTAMVAGAAVSSEGFIHINVHEKQKDGTHLSFIKDIAERNGYVFYVDPGPLPGQSASRRHRPQPPAAGPPRRS